MGWPRTRVGAALHRAVWPRAGGELVLGGLERTGYLLLEGNARGVSQALRLRGGCSEACAPGDSRRRSDHDGSEIGESGTVSSRLSRACRAGQELRDW